MTDTPPTLSCSMQIIAYGPDDLVEHTAPDFTLLESLLGKHPVIWINVEGAVSWEALNKFGEIFKLHPLALEDVKNRQQRAKVEEFTTNHFVVTHMVGLNNNKLETEQLSIFVGKDFVLTFQENVKGDCMEELRERIRRNVGVLRQDKADHLAYAIIDSVVDGYFPVLESIGERLDALEEEIVDKHDAKNPQRVHALKRDVIALRRLIWPFREALYSLYRDSNNLVSPTTRVYMRDCYDHAIRIIDLIENYRELCADLRDLHLVSASNRMNEAMKVIAIITAIFIPPTFIAGVYGMNFEHMPELKWVLGYPFAMVLMLAMSAALVWFLHRRGWLTELLDSHRAESRRARRAKLAGKLTGKTS
jgi:magnesium transporter